MRAVVFTGAGGNEVVDCVERPDPVPQGDEVLLEVRYAALNGADLAQRAGRYPARRAHRRTSRASKPPAA
jgi:NADPH:quinone reductase-like Zn-dependent oxidoreductase